VTSLHVSLGGGGDAIAVSPPLVIEDKHIAEFREKFRRAAEAALA
jgi:4-aminobutyrate aminotransferase-like enzyme